VAIVKIKLEVHDAQHHRRMRPAPAHWRAIANVRYTIPVHKQVDPAMTSLRIDLIFVILMYG